LKIKEFYLVVISFCIFCFCTIFLQNNFYYNFVIAFQIYTTLRLVNNVGNEFALFDFFYFYNTLTTLTLSIFGYEVYSLANFEANLWGKSLECSKEEYYEFLIPCNLALFFSIEILKPKINYDSIRTKLEKYLFDKGKIGIVFIVVGLFFTFFQNVFPASLSVLSGLLKALSFIGPVYILFSNIKSKIYIFSGSIFFMLLGAIASSMFGEFLNITAVMLMIVLPLFKVRFSFPTKLFGLFIALFLVLVLQSIKPVYRQITWGNKETEGYSLQKSSSSNIFRALMWDRITNPEKIFDSKSMFGPYVRFNQGIILAREFNIVPNKLPFTEGSHTARVLASIFIPRIFYPDKYELGGKENMKNYVGLILVGYSMNVGPFGEMYGEFGPVWGVFGVFIYGLILVLSWRFIINQANKNVLWILWIPTLYASSLTVETDIFGTLNTLFKNYILIFVLLKMLERVGLRTKNRVKIEKPIETNPAF
jgi:hypothetical protein